MSRARCCAWTEEWRFEPQKGNCYGKKTSSYHRPGRGHPLGHTARETWEAAKAGVCGIAPITLYDHSAQEGVPGRRGEGVRPLRRAGEEGDPADGPLRPVCRDGGREHGPQRPGPGAGGQGPDRRRLSSGIGGIGTLQTSCETGQSRGFDRVSPFFIPMVITNLAAGHIAIRFGLHGMCICPVAACAAAPMRWVTLSATSGTATPR